jgi:hypothetical protein
MRSMWFGSSILAVAVLVSCGGSSGGAQGGSSGDTTRETFASNLSKNAADQAILAQLRAAGADLTKPRNLRHHLYFHDEARARRVASQLDGRYRTSVAVANDGSADWQVTAEKVMVVSLATIAPEEQMFDRVATAAGGTYDGWEAAAKP